MKSLLAGVALAGLIATAALAQDGPGRPDGPRPPMTRAEVEARATEHFARIDADHDGVITRAELDAFEAARRAEWQAKRKEHRDRAFSRLDKNKDGKLSRAEFDSPPPPGGPEGPEGRFDGPGRHPGGPGGRHHRGHPAGGMMGPGWFERLDADHDGRVTLAEAKAAALARFDRIDTNHDGTLSPDELRGAWAMHHRPGGPEGPGGPRHGGDMPPPPGGPTQRGPGYDLPAGTPPAPPST